MQRKTSIKVDASGKLFVEPLPPATLTPEEEMKIRLNAKKFDKEIEAAFKDGLDLSGQETP